MPDLFLYAIFISLGLNACFFLIAYFLQSDKLTDITYSATFAAIAVTGYLLSERLPAHLITLTLILIWAIRLGTFLMTRVHKLGRDDRFNNIRPYPIKFLAFWTMQALTCIIVSLGALIIFNDHAKPMDTIFLLGGLISILGLSLESIADYQKYSFKNKYPHRFMNQGVWKKIRHPNYSGEILFWIGLSIGAIGSPHWLLAITSPLWISFIIIKFSGISILIKNWEKKYGQDTEYQAYKKQSYKLIPYLF